MNRRNGDRSGCRRRSLCYCVIRRRRFTTTRTECKHTHQPHARTATQLTSLVINIHVPKASIEFSSLENMFNIFFLYTYVHAYLLFVYQLISIIPLIKRRISVNGRKYVCQSHHYCHGGGDFVCERDRGGFARTYIHVCYFFATVFFFTLSRQDFS